MQLECRGCHRRLKNPSPTGYGPTCARKRGLTTEPKLLGLFWGPEGDPDKAHHGIVSGPGFWAEAKNFPPGARLIVTARVELPDAAPQPKED